MSNILNCFAILELPMRTSLHVWMQIDMVSALEVCLISSSRWELLNKSLFSSLDSAIIENFHYSNFIARGNISQHSSGILVALLDQAQKLEPQSSPPVVVIESSKKYVRMANSFIYTWIIFQWPELKWHNKIHKQTHALTCVLVHL